MNFSYITSAIIIARLNSYPALILNLLKDIFKPHVSILFTRGPQRRVTKLGINDILERSRMSFNKFRTSAEKIVKILLMLFIFCNTHAINWVKDPRHGWYVGEIPSHKNQSHNNTYDYSHSFFQAGHHQAVIDTLNYLNSNPSHAEGPSSNWNSSLGQYNHFDQVIKMMAYDEANRDRINGYTPHQSNILRELDVSKGQYLKDSHDYLWDSTLILKNVQTVQDLLNALSNPIIRARLERLKYEYEQKCCKAKQIRFLDSLLSGKITRLLSDIQNPNIITAEAAIAELRNIWPWDRQHSYLIAKRPSGESKFISVLGIDIMKIAERDFVTSQSFIAKHTDATSLQEIEKYKAQCAALQQKGDFTGLCQEHKRLHKIVKKSGKKAKLANIISLAIVQKTLADPITNTFKIIIHAPHIKYAGDALVQGRTRILEQARQENIPSDKIHEWSVSKYGYDAIEEMRDRYKFRYDYTGHEPIQEVVLSQRSESLSPILYNIQDRKLPEAYNELIHCNSHADRILAEENITDPQAQTEYLIKNFDADVREVTQSVYRNRDDHQHLCKSFKPINVSHATTTILNNNHNCTVIADLLRDVSKQVINNAELCQLNHIPQIEDQIVQSLQVIRKPQNEAELIVHVTLVDHLLTDIQCQTDAMVIGKPTLWERSPDLLLRALVSFLSRLDPITQLQDIGSLFIGASKFLGNRALDIITDPVTTTKNSIATTLYVIDFISTFARLTSDATYGLHYLSTQEGQQRIGQYCENIVILGHVIDKSSENITAEQVADATGHIIGDIVFAAGAPAVATFVKEIDALGKISNEAKIIARGIKDIVKEHPAYATAEGLVLKMGEEIKDVGSKVTNSTNKPIAKDITKSAGHIMRENGKAFEDFLVKELGGTGSFKVIREFDGAIGNVWYEAKSGGYWDMILSSGEQLENFKSGMGHRLKIANDNQKIFQLHSNTPIPQEIKEWLMQKNISYTEWL